MPEILLHVSLVYPQGPRTPEKSNIDLRLEFFERYCFSHQLSRALLSTIEKEKTRCDGGERNGVGTGAECKDR